MRLRNIPRAYDIAGKHLNFIDKPEKFNGKWSEFFNNANPLHIEIGSGKGKFITTLSEQNNDTNYIAIEKFISVLVKLIRKLPKEGLRNLAVIHNSLKKSNRLAESIFEGCTY